jgi:hypothetical protein
LISPWSGCGPNFRGLNDERNQDPEALPVSTWSHARDPLEEAAEERRIFVAGAPFNLIFEVRR